MALDKYIKFLNELDTRLDKYFKEQAEFLCCQKGCSDCCEKGDYPISELELKYIMHGYARLNNSERIKIQENIKNLERGGKCPFLINKECSIYKYRPIICRVHGLAYIYKNDLVKVPYCVNNGKNYKTVFENNEFLSKPIQENLETTEILKNFDYGEIRNLYDWINHKN